LVTEPSERDTLKVALDGPTQVMMMPAADR
jgi:hypothetical protein